MVKHEFETTCDAIYYLAWLCDAAARGKDVKMDGWQYKKIWNRNACIPKKPEMTYTEDKIREWSMMIHHVQQTPITDQCRRVT